MVSTANGARLAAAQCHVVVDRRVGPDLVITRVQPTEDWTALNKVLEQQARLEYVKLKHVQVSEDISIQKSAIDRISIILLLQSILYVVNGGYGQWSSFFSCSVSCGGGSQSRIRPCNNPSPANGGLNCAGLGAAAETRACETQACPGKWRYIHTKMCDQ